MSLKSRYDILIKQSVGQAHMLPDCLYYDEDYFEELYREMERRDLSSAFGQLEFKKMSCGGRKICAVASSSRIGFLYGVQNGITCFEKTDVRNGICRPHYDNFDDTTNTFYEYKCHEFTSHSMQHNSFTNNPEGYKKLLSAYFLINEDQIECKDLFKTFEIEPCMFFDFKQFLCHVLGSLSIASIKAPVNLQYVMFIPKKDVLDKEINSDIAEWLKELETQINNIFEIMSKRIVSTYNGEKGLLQDFIKLSFRYQDISEIRDFVYDKLSK